MKKFLAAFALALALLGGAVAVSAVTGPAAVAQCSNGRC
jgi:hypothetical protein